MIWVQVHQTMWILPHVCGCTLGLGRFRFCNFGSILFGFQSQILSLCYISFSIRTSPQCILVCENTKTESINSDKKFQLKYTDRSRRVWRNFWRQVLHTWHGRSICQSVTAVSPSIMAQPIDMPFGLRTRVGPSNHVLLFLVSVFAHHHNAGIP